MSPSTVVSCGIGSHVQQSYIIITGSFHLATCDFDNIDANMQIAYTDIHPYWSRYFSVQYKATNDEEGL